MNLNHARLPIPPVPRGQTARKNNPLLRLTIIHYDGGIRQLPQHFFSEFHAARKYPQAVPQFMPQQRLAEADN